MFKRDITKTVCVRNLKSKRFCEGYIGKNFVNYHPKRLHKLIVIYETPPIQQPIGYNQ